MWKLDLLQNNRWPKLDTYKIIKNDYCIEPHILYVKNKNYQRALTRLRVSAHKLNIEIRDHIFHDINGYACIVTAGK